MMTASLFFIDEAIFLSEEVELHILIFLTSKPSTMVVIFPLPVAEDYDSFVCVLCLQEIDKNNKNCN